MVEVNSTMLDVNDTSRYDSSRSDQEWWLLFCIAVAGKNSDNTARALGKFKFYIDSPQFPLMHINGMMDEDMESLRWAIINAGFGQHTKIERAFIEAARELWCRDLKEVSIEELESIHGIGPKTSRFFKITTVRGARHAALDVHILRWLDNLGYPDIPKSTPTGSNYSRIENYFIGEADKRDMDVNDLDLAVWSAGRDGGTYDG